MGAFGQLLIKSLGGNLDHYNSTGIYTPSYVKNRPRDTKEEIYEDDIFVFNSLKDQFIKLKDDAEKMIKQITDDNYMKTIILSEKAFDDFVKWRKEFLNNL